MSAWIEGLLGAVMGGAKSVEESIKEEEAARRKEEEEKRREQRLLTIEERKEKNAIEKERRLAEQKKAEEEQGRQRVAGYMAPQEQVGVSQSPMEPEGMVTREMKGGDLNTAINRAMQDGRLDVAKSLSEELNRQIKRDIDLREAALKEEKAEKPERETEAARTFESNVLAAYSGPKGADGKPLDPEDFAKFRQRAASTRLFGREKPEGVPGAPAGPKPLTEGQRDAAEVRVGKIVSDLSLVTEGGKKVKDPAREAALNNILTNYKSEVQKSGKDFYSVDLNDVRIELSNRVNAAEKAAKDKARAEFNKYIEDPQKSPLSVQDPVAMAAASKALNVKKDEKKLNAFRSMFVDQAYKSYLPDIGTGRSELPDPLGIRTR